MLTRLTTALAGLLLATTAQATAPDAIIRDATDAVRADIAENVATYQQDKAAFYAMVEEKIVPHFDTTYIAKVILGSHLKAASPEQIGEFETAFKDMLIRTYADKLLEYYDSIEIEVKPARLSGKRGTVATTIIRKEPGKPPIPIEFSVRQAKDSDEWKIWDIKAENISLVLNFRTQLDSEIKRNGIPQVIERIKAGQLVVGDEDSAE
ncbi:MAG: ABC transporter substrate-binding protein [Pseudomonadota bacterium]|uniref:MlaC/ttg2D family ABC transporter substrate-binding protein n=1 Tax=Sinimarinibacterium flocculans TaxID=985250 RepID=UPI002ECB534E|nr:ABC transporter substrate-binding protein [Pseudomonadota bacterium]